MPKERILEFQPKGGFKQLCEFLDKPIPEEDEYLNTNQPDNIFKLHANLWWVLLLLIAVRFAPIMGAFVVGAGGIWYYQRK